MPVNLQIMSDQNKNKKQAENFDYFKIADASSKIHQSNMSLHYKQSDHEETKNSLS